MLMLLQILQFVSVCGNVFGEVITLKRGKTVTCILTAEHADSAVYLQPDSTKRLSALNSSTVPWSTHDWNETNSDYHYFKPITDSRWIELPTYHIQSFYPKRSKFNISLSVCSESNTLTFNVTIRQKHLKYWSPNELFYVTVFNTKPNTEKCTWVHFTICSKNESIALIDGTLERIRKDLSANSWFRFSKMQKYMQESHVRRHLYNFFWSNTTSTQPSTLNIFMPGKVCLHFYVSMDQGCELEITFNVGGKTVKKNIIEGFNLPGELREWKRVTFESNHEEDHGFGTVHFYRTRNSTNTGYWAIDRIQYCRNTAIYTATLESEEQHAICHSINNDEAGINNGPLWYEMNHGCLGNNCPVRCEDILGPNYKYCQEHKICQGEHFNCYCAWGYRGESCKERCSDGAWGLNCLNKCEESCTKCNPYNGTCEALKIPIWKPLEVVQLPPNDDMSVASTQRTSSETADTSLSTPSTKPTLRTTSDTEFTSNIRNVPALTTNTSITTPTPTLTTETKNSPRSTGTIPDLNTNPTPSSIVSPVIGNSPLSTPNLDKLALNTSSTTTSPTLNKTPIPTSSSESGSATFMLYVLYVLLAVLLFLAILYISYWYYRKQSNRRNDINTINLGVSKVTVAEFDNYVRTAFHSGILVNQFNALGNDHAECNVALAEKNKFKNYDKYNLPYDTNRVVLKPMKHVGSSDYINASYIDGWGRSQAYIVTQGPKSFTIPDFWRMVWQHDVKTIVMATNFRENMARECVEYFPLYLNASLPFAEFGIKLVLEEFHEFYEKRVLEIYYLKYQKVVTHYQMTWKPELERPLFANDLVPLVQIMNENYKNDDWNPVVVHCNLGVGRSAMLVLCDIAFQMAKKEGSLDVFHLANVLREHRRNMITSSQEYILAHLVVSECLMTAETCFYSPVRPQESLSLNCQLEFLNIFRLHDNVAYNLSGYDEPASVPCVEYIYRYGGKEKYYYAKQPKNNNNIGAFWLTVLRKKIKAILFLNESKFKPWSFRQDLSDRKVCTVQHLSTSQNSYCITSRMLIKEEDTRMTTLYQAEILLIRLLGWKSRNREADVTCIPNMIQIVEDVRNLDPTPQNLLICCLNGITDCGLFIAMSFIIRKYLKEVEYDISNTIRCLRRSNRAFMSKTDQLQLLYRAISIYSQKFDPYKSIDTDEVPKQFILTM